LAPKSDSPGNGYSLARIAHNGSGVTLAISGEIDIASAKSFTDEVHSLVQDADSEVALDLENCGFIDSTGIRALVALAQGQQAQGRKLKLSGVTGEPQRVLELSGLLNSGLFADSDEDQRRQAA
jgi:anti-anti-sigma factor